MTALIKQVDEIALPRSKAMVADVGVAEVAADLVLLPGLPDRRIWPRLRHRWSRV
jgi:hypothetical protein